MNENAQPASGPDAPEDSKLRELALLLFAPRHLDLGIDPIQQPQLLVGQLPPDLPFDLPLLADSRVVGSFVYGAPTIVIETNTTSADDLLRFYRDRLPEQGWHERDLGIERQGGFVHTHEARRGFAMFIHEDGPSSLHLMTFLGPNGHVVAHINLHDEPRQARRPTRRTQPDIWHVLPPIEPPIGAKQISGGGSAGEDQVGARASLETDLDLATVVAHYAQQLVNGGWVQGETGQEGPLVWNTWTFQDEENEPWRALFFILKRPDIPQRYTLYLEAEWATASSNSIGGSGWITSSRTHQG